MKDRHALPSSPASGPPPGFRVRIAKINAGMRRRERAEDTRRKIVVGAAVLAHAEHDPAFAEALRAALTKGVTREADKVLLADLLG